MEIRKMQKTDWKDVARIYKEGIDTKIATFQSFVPDYESWASDYPEDYKIVYVKDDKILGFAALRKVSERVVYRGVREITVYVDKLARGTGVGTTLINHLIKLSEENGIWTLQSTILSANSNSIKLHQKCGFRISGTRERIGKMDNGLWLDITLMERRSTKIGID